MGKEIIEHLIKDNRIISDMVYETHIRSILMALEKTKSIDGEVVEFGCNIGTTSLFIQRFLTLTKSEKKFYVYDSFEGLPDLIEQDKKLNNEEGRFKKGSCSTSKEIFINNFLEAGLNQPIITQGWFGKISEVDIPDKISFAFFDGDFYSSIIDSFVRVYDKVQPGGIICIHDYQWNELPGVEKACNDFLKGKPEDGEIINEFNLGILVKK